MNKLKKISDTIFDIIELYIPTVCIFICFASFVCQVFSRKILGHQWFWTYETCVISFMFCTLFGGSYAARKHTHVTFDTIYDLFPEPIQKYIDVFISLVGIFVFGALLIPCWNVVVGQTGLKSDMLHLPMNAITFPFFSFVLLTLIHLLTDLVSEISVIISSFKKRGNSI